jgi:hypothetical protein
MADQWRKAGGLAPAQPAQGQAEGETPPPPAYSGPAPPLLKSDADIAAEAGVPQELLDLPLREL